MSIFNIVRRPKLSAQALQQVYREVRTENELRAAVAAGPSSARRIVIAAPITITRTIEITAQYVTVESHGSVPITVADGVAVALMGAEFGSFIGLMFQDPADVLAGATSALIQLGPFGTAERCFSNNHGPLILIDEEAENIVRGCRCNVNTGVGFRTSGLNGIFADNICGGDGFVDTGERNNYGGNMAALGSAPTIDTSGGSGSNVIVGNNGFTIASHGADTVGNNGP